jgi:hypothetical protein
MTALPTPLIHNAALPQLTLTDVPRTQTPLTSPALPDGNSTPVLPGSPGQMPSRRAVELALNVNPRGAGVYPGEQTQLYVQSRVDWQSIHWNDVRQGSAGTCTILATAMSLAHSERGRNFLSRSIADQGDGTIAVTLWNRRMPIALSRIKTMPVGAGDFNGSRTDPRWEIWPKAIEAGFARGAKWLFGVEIYRDRNIGRTDLHMALRAVSDKDRYVTDLASMSPQQLTRDVGRALNEQKVIITGSVDARAMSSQQIALQRQYGLIPNHAYAVLGLNAQEGTIWLGDPHGRSLSIPQSAYLSFFDQIGWGYVP